MLVDIPQDLSRADIPYEPVDSVDLPGYQPTTEGNAKQIRLAAKALANARRPVIYARRRRDQRRRRRRSSRELCLSDRFPVTCTLMGLGGFPAPHEQWLGMLGMHGTRAANYAMDEADLICRDRRPLRRPHHRQAVRVRAAGEVHPHRHRPGRDLQERAGPHPDRRRREEHPAQAHAPSTARWRPTRPRLDGWWERIHGWQEKHPLGYEDSEDSEIKPQYMIEALYEATGGDAIVTSDVGQHQMWAAQYFHFNAPAPLDQLGRPRARWASACPRRWAPRSRCPTRTSSASPATAR